MKNKKAAAVKWNTNVTCVLNTEAINTKYINNPLTDFEVFAFLDRTKYIPRSAVRVRSLYANNPVLKKLLAGPTALCTA